MRRIMVVSLLSGIVALCWIEPAAAQDCGDWSRAMVCTAELVVTDADYDSARLGQRSRIELAPRQQLDLEIEARDQSGRRFPAERLAMRYDERDCSSMLSVEERGDGRLRVAASAAEGRCTLEIWMPNNLNFAWEVDFSIAMPQRIGYDRAESRFIVDALYAAVLNREPEASGFNAAVAEIQAGNLEAQVDAMARSPEFRQTISGMSAAQVLEQFYRGILGREGDAAGTPLYLGELRRGQYASVLLKLIRSPEFERRLQQQR